MTQKEKERYFADRFLNLYPDLQHCILKPDESPDFITTSSEALEIGIEVTELLNSKKAGAKFTPAQRYGLEEKIALMAKEAFLNKYGIPLHVSIAFQDHMECTGKDARIISGEIAEFVYTQIHKQALDSHFHMTVDTNMPSKSNYISITYFPSVTDSIWYSGKGMLVPNPERWELENLVAKKERKLVQYKKKCDSVYLLIIEGIVPYSCYDSFAEVCSHIYQTDFNKVFVLRNLADQLIEIKTTPFGATTTTPATTIK